MSDDEIERIVCAIDGLLARRFLLIVSTVVASMLAVFVFGCAPAPEWSGTPDELPMLSSSLATESCAECEERTRGTCCDPQPAELRCVGDNPPQLVKTYVDCGGDPRVCLWRDTSVWRCPIVIADMEFNR